MAAVVPALDFIFRITTKMGERAVFGPLPSGMRRGFTSAIGGTVEGPRLNGVVVAHSGGDYPLFDEDDNAFFDARYILRADDGTSIYMRNRGMRIGSPEINRRLRANEVVPMDQYYFRTNPVFEAPRGPHDWLNKVVVVGSADRREDYSVFEYYALT